MNRPTWTHPLALALAALTGLAACGPSEEPAHEQPAGQQPVVNVNELGHAKGDPDAPIHIIEFSDFGCPYCARFALESYPALHEEFVETGQVYWQFIPITIGSFPNGDEAARSAECAGEQGEDHFWAMQRRLYAEQDRWRRTGDSGPVFRSLAEEIGLDASRFASCMQEDRPSERMWAHNYVASQLGVRGTPSFLINGMPVEGAPPLDRFQEFLRQLPTQ